MSEHRDMEGLAAAYALDALEPAERRSFEEHLTGCDPCSRDVAAFQDITGTLPLASEEHGPPRYLRERILARARAEASELQPKPGLRATVSQTINALSSRGAVAVALAGAVVVIVGLALLSLQTRSELETAESQLRKTEEAIRIIVSADRRWEFEGTDAQPDARGVLAYSVEERAGSLYVWGLPSSIDGTYNVWTVKDGKRSRVGGLWDAYGGHWIVVSEDIRTFEGFGVTLISGAGATAQKIDLIDVQFPADNPIPPP